MPRTKDCCDKVNKQTVVIKEGRHYSKLVCRNCGAFWKWMPDPRHTIAHMNRQMEIDGLISNKQSSEKEKNFLEGIRIRRHLTPLQNRYYNDIKNRLFMTENFLIDL